jgi:uncharacterized protein
MALYPKYAPEFRIKINDEQIPAALRASLISLSYEDGIQGADRVEITVANEGLRWLDHPLLQVDNGFKLSIGYAPDPLEQVFTGEITGVNASFPNGGLPTLTVVAHDYLQRLTRGTVDRAFAINVPCFGTIPIPDPIVVSLVAALDILIPYPDPVGAALSFLALLIAFAVDPIEARKSIRIQQNESDFDFLAKVAKENGWEMYIDHTIDPQGYVLRFQFLVQDYSPSVTLKWGESLSEFTPKITTVGQVAGISTRIWIPTIQTEFIIILAWDYDRAAFDLKIYPGLGNLSQILGSKLAQGVVSVEAFGPAFVPKTLLSELLPRLNNRLTGSGSAVGDPNIKASRVINLVGLGDEFGGLYRITSAHHTIDSGGYKTRFEARKEVWFGSIPTPKSVAGAFRVQGQAFR